MVECSNWQENVTPLRQVVVIIERHSAVDLPIRTNLIIHGERIAKIE